MKHTRYPHPHGFTLVEIAVVIVIMGLMAALILPGVFRTIERNKLERGRNAVTALKNEIIGYVVANNGELPRPGNYDALAGRIDQWGNPIRYWFAQRTGTTNPINVCNRSTTDLSVTAGDPVDNIAFVLASLGQNMNLETICDNGGATCDPAGAATSVTVFQTGQTDAVNFPGYEYDDIVEYVSLRELKNRACSQSNNSAPGDPFVSLDFSQFQAGLSGQDLADADSQIVDAGSGASIVNVAGIGNVLELTGEYGGGTSTNSYVQLIDSDDPNDFCGYTLMGWFRTPGADDGRRQYITSRRPSHGGTYNTWTVGINSSAPCASSGGVCSTALPPGETYHGASDAGNANFSVGLDAAGRGNAPASVSPIRRGFPFIPNSEVSYKTNDVRRSNAPAPDDYGQLLNTWHFFAANLVPESDNQGFTDVPANGRCRFIDVDDNHIPGMYTAIFYLSENNDGNGDPAGPHTLFARYQENTLTDAQYGPVVSYTTGGQYRIFIGRLGADTGSWVNPLKGQMANFYIYKKDELLDNEDILSFYNQTCPIFSGSTACIVPLPVS